MSVLFIDEFFNVLGDLAGQDKRIFIKDTDGELAEEHLGTKVMTRHYFEKIDEFHTRLV